MKSDIEILAHERYLIDFVSFHKWMLVKIKEVKNYDLETKLCKYIDHGLHKFISPLAPKT